MAFTTRIKEPKHGMRVEILVYGHDFAYYFDFPLGVCKGLDELCEAVRK